MPKKALTSEMIAPAPVMTREAFGYCYRRDEYDTMMVASVAYTEDGQPDRLMRGGRRSNMIRPGDVYVVHEYPGHTNRAKHAEAHMASVRVYACGADRDMYEVYCDRHYPRDHGEVEFIHRECVDSQGWIDIAKVKACATREKRKASAQRRRLVKALRNWGRDTVQGAAA